MTSHESPSSEAGASSGAGTSTSQSFSPPQFHPTTVRPTALHPLQEDPPLVLQDTRSSASGPPAAHGVCTGADSNDTQPHLPKRAPDEDAQAARDRLERIAKAQQTKRNWAKSTGVTVAAKAFGRNDRRMRRRANGASSDDDSSDSTTNDDPLETNEREVKLMITGNPVVTKVFDAAKRQRGRFRSRTDSLDGTPHNEDAPSRLSFSRPGSVLARRLRAATASPPPPDAALKSSANSPSAELPPRGSVDWASSVPERPKSRAKRPTMGPELLVVDEEGQSQQPNESSDRKFSSRPDLLNAISLNSHTPSSFNSSSPSTPGERPNAELSKQVSRATTPSFIDGPLHDEPDAHEHAAEGILHGSPQRTTASSSSSASSDDELDDSALASDSDEEGDNMLKLRSLCLEHGETPTKEQLKRRKKLIRREIRRRKAIGEPIDDLPHMHGKAGQLGHKVSTRVSKGIHYAGKQSRNRRAMDRYSPHPTLALQTSDLPRSGSPQSGAADRTMTPFSAIAPSSRGSNTFGNSFGQRRESVATAASSRRSSLTVDEDDGASSIRNLSGMDRSMLSSRNTIRKFIPGSKMRQRRRQKQFEAEMEALERAADEEARKADPEAELDSMLANFAQQQAPADANKVKYEFDVLYENQRGLLVFGIPKFSPRTLFQWDPSPWTSSNGQKSAYNIANAQLPDPSWEWAYDEWYIDMTGDVDEAGWQYSGNFGRRFWPNVHFPHGRVGLPKTGADGIREMNARLAEKEKKRQEKEDTKEDGGLEAIKRSARARSSKWTGSPDAWTFVRRRRWIRLRRRKPLITPTSGKSSEVPSKTVTPVNEVQVPELGGKTPLSPGKTSVKPGQSDDEAESAFGGSDESDLSSSSSEDDVLLYGPAYGRSSGFLPRRLPGKMSNGPDPTKSKDTRARSRARKHAKEFTGTIRELKSLLPSIIAMDREAKMHRAPTGLTASQSSYKWAMLKLQNVDARNPFISWYFVKSRLQDEDMAFAATTLRTLERKFQQRHLSTLYKTQGEPAVGASSHPPIPSSFVNGSTAAACRSIRFDGDAAGPSRSSTMGLQEPFALSPVEGHELTREALIEINFARVLRVLRACKVDRQRMELWKLWLGVLSLDSLMEIARKEDLAALGLLVPTEHSATADAAIPGTSSTPPLELAQMSGGSSFRYRQRAERVRAKWRSSHPTPDVSDVWDVLERKLDEILLLFEFQSNRAQLIRLLLQVHEKLHPEHVYRDHSLRKNPLELSPGHVHGEGAEMGGPQGVGGAFGSRLGGWKRAGLPRLEFFSDLQRILGALPGNDVLKNKEYICSAPSPTEEVEGVAMPLEHHHSGNPLVAKLEEEALSDTFLGQEHIASPIGMDGDEGEKKRFSWQQRELGGARSPSPVLRVPSVPLPYKHSPLSAGAVVKGSQGSVSSAPRSSLSNTERPQSTPASSAPGIEEEGVPSLKTPVPRTQSEAASEKETVKGKREGKEPERPPRNASRPPIPVRTNSVSPQSGAKERF